MNFKNLKKRDKFWIGRWIFFVAAFLVFALLSFVNLLIFNNSYMEEEREELGIFSKQVEWAITPMLEAHDYKKIQQYCLDFIDEDYRFRIFDKDKNLIATSKLDETDPMLEADNKIFKARTKRLKIYRHSIQDRKIGLLKEVNVKSSSPPFHAPLNRGPNAASLSNTPYYFEIVISEEDVLKNIVKAQETIFILFGLFIIFIIWSFHYVIHKIRVPFDKLEDSIIKIANGELDTPIDIQKQEILHELSIAIKKMANQLKSQIVRLQQLEEYKNDFIQSITHEIKTPITAINMAMELIETEENAKLSPQTKECFDIIKFQTDYINSLTNDILTLAELEDGKVKEDKNFNYFILNETINKVINYNKFPDVKINFVENDIVNLYGDSELISRAVLNILSNANRYANTDKIDITLKKGDKTCTLEIRDYGVGIDDAHKEKVFEKFYRVDKSRSRAKGGTGLGLAIVKNIVELHNGTITLETAKNMGCNFIIQLPLC